MTFDSIRATKEGNRVCVWLAQLVSHPGYRNLPGRSSFGLGPLTHVSTRITEPYSRGDRVLKEVASPEK